MATNELTRIEAVRRYDKFNFDINNNFHSLLRLTSDLFETPVAFITLIDENNQWFKVCKGFEVLSMPRNSSFCTHAIAEDRPTIVRDAYADQRFDGNPFVTNPPHIRFYAGAPLTTHDGQNIGTLCVMDVTPKEVDENKRLHLDILARQVINLMELELAHKMINDKVIQIQMQNNALLKIADIQSHDFRGPLSSIIGVMNEIKEQNYCPSKEYLQLMEQAIHKLDERVHMVVKSTEIANNGYVLPG